MSVKPIVSVIIPVYNDFRIVKCLKALKNQTYPRERYEIIVVDNNSDKHFLTNLRKYKIRLLSAKEGTYAARNKGIKAAKGDILAFTDADCIPAKEWIEKGVDAIRNQAAGLVAGKIELFPKGNRPTIAEMFEIITGFRQELYVKKWHFGATANVFTKKQVINKVGPFNDYLISGGDLEFGKRIFEAGYMQIYAPEVIVWHPARGSVLKILGKHRRVVRGINCIQKTKSIKKLLVDIKDDWPQLADFREILGDRRLKKFRLKASIFFILLLVRFARTSQRIFFIDRKNS